MWYNIYSERRKLKKTDTFYKEGEVRKLNDLMGLIERKSGYKVYDLSLGTQGEVRTWSYGQHEKWFSLALNKEFTLKYVRIGKELYRYDANDEGKAIQKFLSERRKEYEKSIEKYTER